MMKNLILAMCVCASLALLAPDPGLAGVAQNEIGIYATATGDTPYIQPLLPFTEHSMYFVVSNPRYPDGSGPLPAVDGFELKVRAVPDAGWVMFGVEILPPYSLNGGNGHNSAAGTRDYVMEWPTPLPVVNGTVMVMEWSVLFVNAGPYLFYLNPGDNPSIPGFMAVHYTTSKAPYMVGCTPSSGSFSRPVFAAGGTVVDMESVAFGDVKALFR